ncbi:MAG: thymidine phosphorylase [Nanoarchaeota archaeon]|nr:thymidine phosphorylase [Nanoarchaeota archaeon]MBU1028322.1 thymidine phosphorylase [Nanoarchaeota archaeon]
MKLKTKFLNWSAGFPVVMLNEKTAGEMGVPAKGRVLLKTISKKSKETMAITNLVKNIVKENEVAVSSEIKKILSVKKNQKIEVILGEIPKSIELIKKKLDNKPLSEKEIDEIIIDVVKGTLSDPEIALFVSALYKQGLSMKETISLIKAILKTGNRLYFKNKLVVDKHSIGGIAGRTTPIVVSICAAAGLIVPKTSSRAITSAAGTADILESVADVDFPLKKIKKIIRKTNACIVWGGSLGLVPADSKIINVEKLLKIDPEAQLLSSIIAKKLAVGSKYIVIDIPYGKTAKVNKSKALKLKKNFEKIARYFNKNIKCLLVENTGPLGNSIGPCLELIDVLKILRRESPCHLLEKRSLELSGALLEMSGKAKKNQGKKLAKEILDSGKALDKFKQIIKAQNGDLNRIYLGKFKKNILASSSGKIQEIDNKNINLLARITGSPIYKGSGISLHKNVGSRVQKGQSLLTIYSESKTRLRNALDFYKKSKPVRIN